MAWIWHMCITNMRKRGIRTALTVLGVVIGVISIVTLMAIGLGVKEVILDEATIGGSVNEIMVYGSEGKRKELMLTDRSLGGFVDIAHVEGVYPQLELSDMYSFGSYEGYMQILGMPQEYLDQLDIKYGGELNVNAIKPELIMGSHAMDYCYNVNTGVTYLESYQEDNESQGFDKDTIPDNTGKSIKLYMNYSDSGATGQNLNIVAISDDAFYYSYCNIDVLKKFLKKNAENGVIKGQPLDSNGKPYSEWIYSSAVIVVDDVENVDAVTKKIQDMGFQAESNKEYVDMVMKVTKVIQFLLGGIGAIALVVAVIGIGNTMTTAVYDRVKEIGVLKVLGCDPEELLGMFLLESGILGGLGGMIGIAISYLFTYVGVNIIAVKLLHLAKGTQLATIPWWLAVGSVVFAIVLGIIAGFFPAKWASKLKPIDAVRSL